MNIFHYHSSLGVHETRIHSLFSSDTGWDKNKKTVSVIIGHFYLIKKRRPKKNNLELQYIKKSGKNFFGKFQNIL